MPKVAKGHLVLPHCKKKPELLVAAMISGFLILGNQMRWVVNQKSRHNGFVTNTRGDVLTGLYHIILALTKVGLIPAASGDSLIEKTHIGIDTANQILVICIELSNGPPREVRARALAANGFLT